MWREVTGRLLLALTATTTIALTCTNTLISGLAPFIEVVTEQLQPNKVVHLELSEARRQDGAQVLAVRTLLLKPVPLGRGVSLRAGSRLPATYVDAAHLLVPPVIVWTVVLAWPLRDYRRRAWSLLVGLIASGAVAICITALLIGAKIDILVMEGAEQVQVQIPESMLVWTAMLLELGGAWVVAVTVGILVLCRPVSDVRPATSQ